MYYFTYISYSTCILQYLCTFYNHNRHDTLDRFNTSYTFYSKLIILYFAPLPHFLILQKQLVPIAFIHLKIGENRLCKFNHFRLNTYHFYLSKFRCTPGSLLHNKEPLQHNFDISSKHNLMTYFVPLKYPKPLNINQKLTNQIMYTFSASMALFRFCPFGPNLTY